MKIPKVTTIDFESFGIEGRPDYPPKPVGVSIKYWKKKSIYYAFGHPTENNCTEAQAKKALKEAWKTKEGILFHNSKFDVDIAVEHWNLKMPKWDQIHDTLFLLFLDDPHQTKLGLKPSAQRLLGMDPEEQDAVEEWLMKNQPIEGVKISRSGKSPHYWGKYIAYAPGNLVGRYARGDTDRTVGLFTHLWKTVMDRGMYDAYNRERELMPILLEMEQQGLPVNLSKLKKDVKLYSNWITVIDDWIIRRIKAPADINLNSGPQLVKAMLESGRADPDLMELTPTGKYATNKAALLEGVTDKLLLAVLNYRAPLLTCLNTFMKPWLEIAQKSRGLIYTSWNQVKMERGGDTVGTRTGRLSSTPNFQNIPNKFPVLFKNKKNKKLPKCPWQLLPPLPQCRNYIIPFKGEIFIDRDYSQQEPRILAHFEDGMLMEKYLENPWMDIHDDAREELENAGLVYERKPVKNTNLGLIYGMGVAKLADKNDMDVKEAGDLKKAILYLYPGLKEMYSEMRRKAKNHEPIKTWGGREYYCEEPKLIKGRLRTFDYKLVNILIQGSAADCTKEAIIRYHKAKGKNDKIVLNVHDQITASVHLQTWKISMEIMKECMDGIEFDVQMLTEGSTSKKNWGELKDYDKKGVVL